MVPSNMRTMVFTTCDIYNCDKRKRSNLSRCEFHGTVLSVTNHISHNSMGLDRDPLDISNVDLTIAPKLPDSYATVQHVELKSSIMMGEKPTRNIQAVSTRICGEIVKDVAGKIPITALGGISC